MFGLGQKTHILANSGSKTKKFNIYTESGKISNAINFV